MHWLAHCHGALELAKLYKQVHPETKTILGGISSTYYHQELIEYEQIDYIIRGYDTLLPFELLLKSNNDSENLLQIPNLTWKDKNTIVNEMAHTPNQYSASVNWEPIFNGKNNMTPYNIVIPQAGCEYNCRWCGGSKYFFKKYMGINKCSQKSSDVLQKELQSIVDCSQKPHTVTMINYWHNYDELFNAANHVFYNKNIDCVHISLNTLPPIKRIKQLASSAKLVIELSPDSHDMEVGKASGRSKYTMDQMEKFIDELLEYVYSFEIYFMLGLPKQTVENIWQNVDYCEHLLQKYQGKRVIPFVCPMLPFLDPGSEIYDNPEKWGYTIFFKTLQEHCDALLSMNWKNRLNYETKWLTRQQLVNISYESVKALTRLKNRYGMLPNSVTKKIINLIDETTDLLKEIDEYEKLSDGKEKDEFFKQLREKILKYNQQQFATVRSQQRPIDFGFAKKQWFETVDAFSDIMD